MLVGKIILFIILFSGCTSTEELQIGMKENEKIINLKVGQIFILELPSNPSTGYQWEVFEIDNTLLKPIGKSEFTSSTKSQIVGAPGIEKFKFKAIKKGKTKLTLQYKRPWENKPPSSVFSVFVIIE